MISNTCFFVIWIVFLVSKIINLLRNNGYKQVKNMDSDLKTLYIYMCIFAIRCIFLQLF